MKGPGERCQNPCEALIEGKLAGLFLLGSPRSRYSLHDLSGCSALNYLPMESSGGFLWSYCILGVRGVGRKHDQALMGTGKTGLLGFVSSLATNSLCDASSQFNSLRLLHGQRRDVSLGSGWGIS